MENILATASPNPVVIEQATDFAAWYNTLEFGVLQVTGADRLDLLHRITTNDFSHLDAGKGRQTVLITDKARIVDVVTVLHSPTETLLLTTAGKATEVVSWIRKYVIMEDVQVKNVSGRWGFCAVVGPHSASAVTELTGTDVRSLELFAWVRVTDPLPLTIVRMPSVADLGYVVMAEVEHINRLAEHCTHNADTLPKLSEADIAFLKVCRGIGSVGVEYTDAYNPLEAGLLHITSFNKGCYIGQEVLARLDSYNKVKQRLMGLTAEVLEPGAVLYAEGNPVGKVTSASPTYSSNATVAIGYVRKEYAHEGAMLYTQTDTNNQAPVTVHLLPMPLPCL